ncbi:MAG TPA: ROK family protein [Acidimicrobiia bacterium]
MLVLGVDIGGSGVKAAPFDVDAGKLAAERKRLTTPQPATPDAVAGAVAELVEYFDWNGPVGCAFPAVIRDGVVFTAVHIDPAWIGISAQDRLGEATGCPITVINDADAAGLAEMRWGSGRDRMGLVLVLTFGTGIGSGMFFDGRLVPNTELGHVQLHGDDAEEWAAADVRSRAGLSLAEWAGRACEYLAHLEAILSPDLFIIGGGISKRYEEFAHLLVVRAPIVAASLRNNAGLAGAALRSYQVSMPHE